MAEVAPAPRRFRPLFLVPIGVFAVLTALFLFRLGEGGDPSRVPSVLIGKPVPVFSLAPLAEIGRAHV